MSAVKYRRDVVSVIIPAYNSAEFLEENVQSISNQSYAKLEIVIVNDGSTDETGDIIEKMRAKDSRIVAIHQDNVGLSGARNTGMRHATGEYLTFMDSDDYIDREYIAALVSGMRADDCDIMCAPRVTVYGDVKVTGQIRTEVMTGMDMARDFLASISHEYDAAWGKLFRTATIMQQGLAFPVGRRHEDIVFLLTSYIAARRIGFIDNAFYYYVQRPSSITNQARSDDYDYDLVLMAHEAAAIAVATKGLGEARALAFVTHKHLAYVYTRVRKRARIVYKKEVRRWLWRHWRAIVTTSYIGTSIKLLALVILVGEWLYRPLLMILAKIRRGNYS